MGAGEEAPNAGATGPEDLKSMIANQERSNDAFDRATDKVEMYTEMIKNTFSGIDAQGVMMQMAHRKMTREQAITTLVDKVRQTLEQSLPGDIDERLGDLGDKVGAK